MVFVETGLLNLIYSTQNHKIIPNILEIPPTPPPPHIHKGSTWEYYKRISTLSWIVCLKLNIFEFLKQMWEMGFWMPIVLIVWSLQSKTNITNHLLLLYSESLSASFRNLQNSYEKIHEKITLPELKTLEWNILNPDRLINLEINNKRRTSII